MNFTHPIFRNHNLYLLLILILGAILRLLRLDYQSLWFDELASIVPVSPRTSLTSVIEHAKHDQPPAFFILLYTWFKIFPYTPYSGRLFVAILGIIGIGAVYLLGKDVKDKNVGLCASAITALNFFHIYYSQELRFYSLLFLLTVLSYLFFIKCFKNPSIKNYIGYSFISIALLYTHYYGMVVLAAQVFTFLALVLLFNKRSKKFIILSVSSGVLILLSFSPWLPVIFGDNQIESFWIKKPDIFFSFLYLYNYFGKEPVAFIASLMLMGLAIRHFIICYKSKNSDQKTTNLYITEFVLIAWLLLSYLIPYIYSVVKIPMLHERYTIVTLPSIILLTALGWNLIQSRRLKILITLAVVLATFMNLALFNPYYTKFHKLQFRELVMELKDYDESHTKIYSDQPWYFNFYFEQFNSKNKLTDINGVDFAADTTGIKKVWILQAPALSSAADMNYLLDNYTITKKISYGDLQAILFEVNE
jgi:uncharacterized membrane protein